MTVGPGVLFRMRGLPNTESVFRHQLVSRGTTLFDLESAHRRSGLSLKNYGVVSVVSPGYGHTGEASLVPCWVIRTVRTSTLWQIGLLLRF